MSEDRKHPSSSRLLGVKKNPRRARLFSLMIGLIMSVVIASVSVIAPLYMGIRARSWKPINCTIVESRVRIIQTTRTRSVWVLAYNYHFEGKEFRSDRYYFMRTGTSGGAGVQADQDLATRYPAGTQAVCYVNPNNPSEAVLNRDLICSDIAVVGMIFIIVGLFCADGIFWVFSYKPPPVSSEPLWRQRADWRTGCIAPTLTTHAKAIWVLAPAFVIFSLVLILIREAIPTAFVFLFCLAAVSLIILAIRNWLQWRRFSGATFEMSSMPARTGGKLQGEIRFPQPITNKTTFRLCLRCLVIRGKGRARTYVAWQRRCTVSVQPNNSVPVQIDIAPECLETTSTDDANRVYWRLEVDDQDRMTNCIVGFVVPVFRKEENRAHVPQPTK